MNKIGIVVVSILLFFAGFILGIKYANIDTINSKKILKPNIIINSTTIDSVTKSDTTYRYKI